MVRTLTQIVERALTLEAVRVKRIFNLTKKTVWVYGTSGDLIKLAPDKLELPDLRLQDKAVTYLVDDENKKLLLQLNPEFETLMAVPVYVGTSREDLPIYRAESLRGGIHVIPITEHFGHPGKVYATRLRLKKAIVD